MMWLSRLRLSRDPSARALAPLLMPNAQGMRRSAQHNLLWSVFTDGPDRARDFLWREEAEGCFLTLSARPPVQTDLFEPHEIRAFSPALAPGDRLAFRLRCNATRQKGGDKRVRVDVVMDALHSLSREERAARRMTIADEEGQRWLAAQGKVAGFTVITAQADDYSAEVLSSYRGPRKGQPQFGILELSGFIEVVDPVALVGRLGQGFGRAKAFGCGLMLIRRSS